MKLQFVLALLLFAMMESVAAEMEVPDVKEGMWEITSQMEMPGMPMAVPSVISKQCYTKQSMKPENILRNNHCTMQKMDLRDNSVSWQMRCQQQGMQMTGTGNIDYQHTSFSGNFNMKMSGANQPAMQMNTRLKGRYIGPCQ